MNKSRSFWLPVLRDVLLCLAGALTFAVCVAFKSDGANQKSLDNSLMICFHTWSEVGWDAHDDGATRMELWYVIESQREDLVKGK